MVLSAIGLIQQQFHRHNCNAASIVSAMVGIAGGAITIPGIILFPPLAIAGAAISGASTAVNVGIVLTEYGITRSQQKTVRRAIQLDTELRLQLEKSYQGLLHAWTVNNCRF